MYNEIVKELSKYADKKRAVLSQRYSKTGKGQYAEGDVFLGITSPIQRKIAKEFANASFSDLQMLLESKIHEYRQIALFILVMKFNKSNDKSIVKFYLKNLKHVNNWGLVDISAPKILGKYLLNNNRKILYKLAKSKKLWKKRIAVLATFAFIRENDFTDTLKISKLLLNDNHDLIHKVVGWMLRELGKRDMKILEKFLKKYSKIMPRTMLRYAIEKFPREKREFYSKK